MPHNLPPLSDVLDVTRPTSDEQLQLTRGRIAVPMRKVRVDTAKLPSADPRQPAPAPTWVLSGPLQRHYAFPGPALLPNSAGGWTPNAQAFALGHWAGIPARPYMLTAASATGSRTAVIAGVLGGGVDGVNTDRADWMAKSCHPKPSVVAVAFAAATHASANTALHQAPASRAFVAGGACGVSWTLLNPEAYRNAEHLPDSVHWHLEFEVETPEGGQRQPYVKRYFEIEFRRDLRAVQDEVEEREMLARGPGGGHSSVAREMGRGQEAAGQWDRRMAACWPEARQARQW
ncbi:hypothetical protein JCM11641_000099 [Rhodosporidiobolus odoratus]